MTVVLNPSASFGPLVIEPDVDAAVLRTLNAWMNTYLNRFEAERGLDHNYFQRPSDRSYVNALTEEEFTDQKLPAIAATATETDEEPTKNGDGVYSVAYNVEVSAICRGNNPVGSRFNAASLSGCCRRILEQQCDLGGFASEVEWLSSSLGPIADPVSGGRYLVRGINTFRVWVDQVLSQLDGPFIPDPDDPPVSPYPDPDPSDPDQTYDPPVAVSTVTVEIDGVPINSGGN